MLLFIKFAQRKDQDAAGKVFIKSSQQKGQTIARGAGQTYALQKI
jgi:hypothetical protein